MIKEYNSISKETNGHIQLEEVTCPRCASDKSTIVFKGKDFLYKIQGTFFASECENCKLWFQNPRPIAAHINSLYPALYTPHASINKNANEYIAPAKKKYLKKKLGYSHLAEDSHDTFDWRVLPIFNSLKAHYFGVNLVPFFVPNGKLLEIGCASGARLIELRKLGWQQLYGIELIPEAVEKAKAEGLSVECGQIEDTIQNYPDNYFDVIVTSMVVEHFFNPFDVFQKITKKLKPGGQLLFSTVVRDSIDGKLYKGYWAGFDFPRHMAYFKKKDLLNALTNSYENIKCFYQNAPIDYKRSSSWKLESNKGNIFDSIIVNTADSIFAKIIGQCLAWLQLTTRVSFRCTKKIT